MAASVKTPIKVIVNKTQPTIKTPIKTIIDKAHGYHFKSCQIEFTYIAQ